MPIIPAILQRRLNPILKKIQRSALYYQRYNNTLNFKINEAYFRHIKACSHAYTKRNGKQTFNISPLTQQSAQVVKNIISKEDATTYSNKITSYIESGHEAIEQLPGYEGLMHRYNHPLKYLGTDFMNVFYNPQLHEALLNFFKGDYKIEWVSGMRTYPSDKKITAWKWHSDSFPPHTCKLFLHLTPVSGDSGATEFMSPKDTTTYRNAGYFGQHKDDRLESLEEFAKDHHLPHRPFHFDAEIGDGSLFNMNYFHRATSPVKNYRDVIEFYLIPNMIPWDEQFAIDGIDALECDDHHYYPKNPQNR